MSLLTKKMICEIVIKEFSISSPTLDKYFKHVFIGLDMKERIDKAKRKLLTL